MAASTKSCPDEPVKQLRDAHNEAELFINAVPSILIGMDSQGRIARWNRAASQTFGLNAVDVLGKTLNTCGIKWMSENIESTIRDCMPPERRLSLDDVRFERSGCSRRLGLNINWIEVANGGAEEVLIVGSDITEKKQAEDELRSKTAFLEAQMQATIDGILVVDENANVLFHNRRFVEIFHVPEALWSNKSDELLLQHVLE